MSLKEWLDKQVEINEQMIKYEKFDENIRNRTRLEVYGMTNILLLGVEEVAEQMGLEVVRKEIRGVGKQKYIVYKGVVFVEWETEDETVHERNA